QGTLAGKPAEFKPADQIATAKSSYEAAVSNAKELAEIAMKAQSEAVDVLTKAMMANIDDLKSLAKAA
ncbi:MAG TPA: phasin family protein, partial [Geminicoccaceae bacterium]|nr:phasin family protein [Geminicoccaceae bacterium]